VASLIFNLGQQAGLKHLGQRCKCVSCKILDNGNLSRISPARKAAGLHLSFCFGEDEHFDLSAVSCAVPQQAQETVLSDQTHHENCLDVHLPCGGQKQLAVSDAKPAPSNSANRKKNSSSPPAFCAGAASWSIHSPPAARRIAFSAPVPSLPPFHLSFLQTVVLII
jgi:hypothetical protein